MTENRKNKQRSLMVSESDWNIFYYGALGSGLGLSRFFHLLMASDQHKEFKRSIKKTLRNIQDNDLIKKKKITIRVSDKDWLIFRKASIGAGLMTASKYFQILIRSPQYIAFEQGLSVD